MPQRSDEPRQPRVRSTFFATLVLVLFALPVTVGWMRGGSSFGLVDVITFEDVKWEQVRVRGVTFGVGHGIVLVHCFRTDGGHTPQAWRFRQFQPAPPGPFIGYEL